MRIEIKITCDEKALEFSRNLGGISEYFKEALITNAMEEHGISAREICEPENLKVEIPVEMTAKKADPVQIVESDPEPKSDSQPKYSLEEVRAAAMAKLDGARFKALLNQLGAKTLTTLDPDKYGELMELIDHA